MTPNDLSLRTGGFDGVLRAIDVIGTDEAWLVVAVTTVGTRFCFTTEDRQVLDTWIAMAAAIPAPPESDTSPGDEVTGLMADDLVGELTSLEIGPWPHPAGVGIGGWKITFDTPSGPVRLLARPGLISQLRQLLR